MFKTTVGAKMVMAVTGLGLFAFVIAHLLGNLQIFLGPLALNTYAHKLRTMPALLWAARLGLLTIFVLHVAAAAQLWLRIRAARPIPYHHKHYIEASFASRTMMLSGMLVLLFIAYHLAHFTFHVVHQETIPLTTIKFEGADEQVFDVYRMVVLGFRNVLISGLYIAGQIVLGFHLSHGVSSLFQTLGLKYPRQRKVIEALGPICAAAIVLGNISMPLAVLAGWIPLAPMPASTGGI